MLRWRRRNDGFEWQQYVRTTILVRRKQRKEQVVAARDAAIGGIKEAGRVSAAAGAVGLAASGRGLRATAIATGEAAEVFAIRSARALRSGVVAIAKFACRGATSLAAALSGAATHAGSYLSANLPHLRDAALSAYARPGFRIALALAALFATVWFAAGMMTGDSAIGAAFAAGAGLVAFIAVQTLMGSRLAMPAAIARLTPPFVTSMPLLAKLDPRLSIAAAAGVVVVVVSGLVWLSGGGLPSLASLQGSARPGESGKLDGRATSVRGDVIRVASTSVKLAGIEAPELAQRCARPGDKRWRCGQAATDALGRIVRGKTVACEARGSDDTGRPLATCVVDGKDIAAELVRDGHVFATGLLFPRYGSLEKQAQAQKVGLWRGEADRPADYRAKIWDAAKKKAPDACPIKGQVSSDGKVYVLPWSPDYERIKLRTQKGERYFCSEREALAAGWKPSSRG